jgi:hypothetical protein
VAGFAAQHHKKTETLMKGEFLFVRTMMMNNVVSAKCR